jgi:hypothetical protein
MVMSVRKMVASLSLRWYMEFGFGEKSGYNKWVSRFGAIWYGYYNASDQTPIHPEWTVLKQNREE